MLRIAGMGIGSKDGHILAPAVARLSEDYDIELICGDAVDLDGDPERLGDFLKKIKTCDSMLICVHGDVTYFRHFRELKDTLDGSGCSALLVCSEPETTAEYRALFRQGDEDYLMLRRLEEIGGDDNQRAVVLWALKTFAGADVGIPEPVMPPAQGIYVPGEGYVPLGEGIRRVGGKGLPVIAVLFHQKYFLTHNTAVVDELCRDIEERGAEPVAIFTISSVRESVGSIGLRGIVDGYLIRDGRSVVDCVVNTMGFAQTLLAEPGDGTQVSEDNFFERLGVPVLQAVTLYGDPKIWRESPFGLAPADIAMSVVNPEYDGQIDTVPVCGTVLCSNGSYRTMPIPDRCRMVADAAFRWASLRHVPDGRRRVAVIVYMYPPRQDLAGGGYGLDTFQSVSDMLRAMKGRGYSLDWVPEDGRELVSRMLEGITNDDGWKSDAQLRRAAGEFVEVEQYKAWFEGIAESARRRMVEGGASRRGTSTSSTGGSSCRA